MLPIAIEVTQKCNINFYLENCNVLLWIFSWSNSKTPASYNNNVFFDRRYNMFFLEPKNMILQYVKPANLI